MDPEIEKLRADFEAFKSNTSLEISRLQEEIKRSDTDVQYRSIVPKGGNFKLMSPQSIDPGHKHTSASLLGITDAAHQTFVTGEAIDASSVPKAVYLKASDGKVYRTDATSAGEAAMDFVGFIDAAQNLGSGVNGSVYVLNRGIVTGFTGLTVGAYYFTTNTAGVISTTPGTFGRLIGQAVTTTTLCIMTQAKYMEGIPATLGSYLSTNPSAGNTTDQVTVGFRPRLIKLYYYLQAANGGLGGLAGRKGIVTFFGTTQLADFCIFSTVATAGHNMTADDGNVQNIDALIAIATSTTNPTTGDQLSNNGVKFTLSVSAVDDASFTINLAIALSSGYSSAGANYRCRIYYEAFQ